MTFANVPAGESVFVDANTFIYHFSGDPKYGSACTQFIKRVELRQILGFTSAHVVSDVAHRLMTLEAISGMGWPFVGIAARLRKHHVQVPTLSVYARPLCKSHCSAFTSSP
jgi:predicted nucleic acid-binding protein